MHYKKPGTVNIPAVETPLGLIGMDEEAFSTARSVLFVSSSNHEPSSHPGLLKNVKVQRDLISLVLLFRCLRTWYPPCRNLNHEKVIVKNILSSLMRYANSIGYSIYSQLIAMDQHVFNAINAFLDGGSYWM